MTLRRRAEQLRQQVETELRAFSHRLCCRADGPTVRIVAYAVIIRHRPSRRAHQGLLCSREHALLRLYGGDARTKHSRRARNRRVALNPLSVVVAYTHKGEAGGVFLYRSLLHTAGGLPHKISR